jgi:hypothetical protein
MKKSKPKPCPEGHKCVVQGCTNHKGEGEFVGVFCRPCYDFAVTGTGMFSQSYRNALKNIGRLFGLTIGAIFFKACDPSTDIGFKGVSMADAEFADMVRKKKG